MSFRKQVRSFALGPLIGSAVAGLLVLTITGVTGNWSRAFGQECASPGIGVGLATFTALDVSAAPLADNGNGNGNGNDNGDNGNGNGNGNKNKNGNGNDNARPTPAVSCDPAEAAIGAQPRAQDTVRVTLDSDHTGHTSLNGVVSVDWVSGGPVILLDDPVDPGVTPGPAAPAGLRQIRAGNLQMIPPRTPNDINVVLHYTDADVQGADEATLQLMVWHADSGTWLTIPSTSDTVANTVTANNIDVSLFGQHITRIGLFIRG